MYKIVTSLLLALAVNQAVYADELPADIKSEISEFVTELDMVAKQEPKAIKEILTEFLKEAPNEKMKQSGIKLMLSLSKSEKVKAHLQRLAKKN